MHEHPRSERLFVAARHPASGTASLKYSVAKDQNTEGKELLVTNF